MPTSYSLAWILAQYLGVSNLPLLCTFRKYRVMSMRKWNNKPVHGPEQFFLSSIRGRLGSIHSLFQSIGIVFGYILGSSVDYEMIPCISVIIPITFAIIFSIFPNTPQYYLAKGQLRVWLNTFDRGMWYISFMFQEAEVALKYYKGYEGISRQEEIAILKEFLRLVSIANKRNAEKQLRAVDICRFLINFAIQWTHDFSNSRKITSRS